MGVFRHIRHRPRRPKFVPSKVSAGTLTIGKVTGTGRLSPFGRHPGKVIGVGVAGHFTILTSGRNVTETGRGVGDTIDERGNRVIGGKITERGERIIVAVGGSPNLAVLIGQVIGVGDARSFLTVRKVIGVGQPGNIKAAHMRIIGALTETGSVGHFTIIRTRPIGKVFGIGGPRQISPTKTAKTLLIVKVIAVGQPRPLGHTQPAPNWADLDSNNFLAVTLESFDREIGAEEADDV